MVFFYLLFTMTFYLLFFIYFRKTYGSLFIEPFTGVSSINYYPKGTVLLKSMLIL